MAENSDIPYSWLKEVDPSLLEQDEIPLFGNIPSFPWEEFSKELSQIFSDQEISCLPGEVKWRAPNEMKHDLGDNLFVQSVCLSSFDGHITFVIDREDLRYLLCTFVCQLDPEDKELFDEEIEQGCLKFVMVAAVKSFSSVSFGQTLSPHLLEESKLPEKGVLSMDIQVTFQNHPMTLRLLIPDHFLISWREHFADRLIDVAVSKELVKNLETSLHLEVGAVQLKQKEIKQIKPGDFIFLDRCTLDPESNSGQIYFTLQGKPKARASFEEGVVTLIEPPSFYEEIRTITEGSLGTVGEKNNEQRTK